MNYTILIELLIFALAAGALGFMIGRKTAQKPAGRIVFEKQEDGNELCIFKLQEDEAWLAKQKTVAFEVLHFGDGFVCAPYNDGPDNRQ